jgi:hypothetical protein
VAYRGANSAPIGLHYSGPRFVPTLVALGNAFGAPNVIGISRNAGLAWSTAVAPATAGVWSGAAFSRPLGYAIAISSVGVVARALGATPLVWALFAGNLAALGAAFGRVIWTDQNGGRFVAVMTGGVLGLRAVTSVDGSAWIARPTPVAGGAVSYTELIELPTGRIIAGGVADNVPFIFSDDGGDTWAFCGALPGARVDGSDSFIALPSGAPDVYFPSDFTTGGPFSDYLSNSAGAAFTQLQVFPGAGGGVTCCAVSPAGVIIRGDGTGLFRTTVGQLVAPPPDIYAPSLPGVNVQDMVYVSAGFVGLQLDGATLTARRSPLGLVGTWSTVIPGVAGDYRRLEALAFP